MKKKIELANGFKCTIDENVLDDMYFVDLLADADEKPYLLGRLAEKLFGKEQKDKLYKHLETKDGRVPPTALSDAIEEAFNKLGEEEKN